MINMDYSTLAIIASLLFIAVYTYFVHWKYRHLPPGPYGIPVLGYLLFMGAKPHVTFMDLTKKYGGTFTVNLGGDQTVVVNDWEGIREVLVKQGDAFASRPYIFTFDTLLRGRENDIVTTSGPMFKELKRCSTKILKDCGMGRSSLESVVVNEVEKLAAHLTTLDGQLVAINHIFSFRLMNTMWGILSGKTLDMKDSEVETFVTTVSSVAGSNNINILNVFPFLRFIAPELTGYTKYLNASKIVAAHIDKIVDRNFDDGDNISDQQTDFIHTFAELSKKPKKSFEDQSPYSKNNAAGVVLDLLTAGIETTDTTLCWALLLMAYHPDIQAKVQCELDDAIPKDSHLPYSSRTMTPYTEATLCEIQRFVTIVPLSIPHCTTRKVSLLGYLLPAKSTVLTNLFALHNEEQYWGDPEAFRPDRFIDEEGRLKKYDRFIPFSAGPRACLGEPLAKLELSLYFSSLMRRFFFQLDPNHPKSKSMLEPKAGIVLRPDPFSLIVTCR